MNIGNLADVEKLLNKSKDLVFILALVLLFPLIVFSFFKLKTSGYLNFSDSAKYALVARNIVQGNGYQADFSFFGSGIFQKVKNGNFPGGGTLPVTVYLLSLSFKLFGISDFSVILIGVVALFFTLVISYLLGKKLSGRLLGILFSMSLLFNQSFLEYALNGATEIVFTLEIVLAAYLFLFKKRWADANGLVILVLMYFTRPQAFIYILGFIILWLFINFDFKKAIGLSFLLIFLGLFTDKVLLTKLHGVFHLYSITGRGVSAANQHSSSQAVSDTLRGSAATVDRFALVKKVFYNLYNLYKLVPRILNPYLFGLYLTSLFLWKKSKLYNSLKATSLLMIILTFLVTAVTIPFFRYVHPVIPFIYLWAIDGLIRILSQNTNVKSIVSNKMLTIAAVTLVFFGFVVVQNLGAIFLDSRFENRALNVGKPPVYVKLSEYLKKNTEKDSLVVTNLDTWGSWYGDRKTVWFPLDPKQLVDPSSGKIPFDAIYLSNYLIDDDNYRMGNNWRQIFFNPNDPEKWTCEGCEEIKENFTLKSVNMVSASENYQNVNSAAILLVKKNN